MAIVSAKYVNPDPIELPGMPRSIQAIDSSGQVWALREDSQVGEWLRYIEEGGTIDGPDPDPEQPATKPA